MGESINNLVRKPDAGNLPVRFDERDLETEHLRATAPDLDSTRGSQVDALLAKAKAAGAPVTELHDRPWGIYSGYFRDLDGHLWEIIHNPNAAASGNV